MNYLLKICFIHASINASGDNVGVENKGDKNTMEKNIEELILQELREIKGAVNSLCERMDSMEKRMDSIEKRMDSMEKRMDALEKRMDLIENRMDALEKRMDLIENQMDALKNRMDTIEETIADMVESIMEIRTASNSLLAWADEVYDIERVNNPNYARVGSVRMRNLKNIVVEEENARYYVESRGKRTYY